MHFSIVTPTTLGFDATHCKHCGSIIYHETEEGDPRKR